MILTLFAAVIARSDNERVALSRKVSISSSQTNDPIRTTGSQIEREFRSQIPKYLLVTDVLDDWGGESKSTGYSINVSAGGQGGGTGSSESSEYKANSGLIPAVLVKRGDVNETGLIDIGDVIYIINYLYRAGNRPVPLESGDLNCDGACDVGDVVYLINYLFKQGLPPCR
jgi:hypothetical protein